MAKWVAPAKTATQEAAYQFMRGIAGDLPRYEEGLCALFADDRGKGKLEQCIAAWSEDIRVYALRPAFGPSNPSMKEERYEEGDEF